MDSKATVFEFTSYSFDPAKKLAVFNYKTEFSDRESLTFTETILLPKTPATDIPKELLEKLLQSLHIILGISYYKFYCGPAERANPAQRGATKVKLPYALSKGEAEFWNIVYKKGLGDFFYKNNLNPKISPQFPYKKNTKISNLKFKISNSRCLVGIGGGKDSIVAAELLKQNGFDITAFVVQTNKESALINSIIETIGIGDLKIQRFLDWQVFQQHQYNGHIPISAVYAFLGVFAAALYNYSYVIMGNEYSSNFGNLKYKGLLVNHQWSKSFEFEKLFQDYVKNSISPDIFYFSLLRPFYEIRIVKMFAQYKKYFPHFSSCNSNFKINPNHRESLHQSALSQRKSAMLQGNMLWCGQCAKCVFAFTLLSAYLGKKELLDIFGKNLYEDKNLLPLFKDILGFGTMKPFDCIGTFQEARVAMHLAKKNFSKDFIVAQLSGPTPPSGVRPSLAGSGPAKLADKMNDTILIEDYARAKLSPEVFKTQKENSIPEHFKFLGMESALILGYGKEGKITEKYLKKYYPKIKIGIAEIHNEKEVFRVVPRKIPRHSAAFDIAIKTPGIKKELVKIPYTTATNIFFSRISGKNTIIGVTGSKGKSTTSSLIYHILKTAGKNVELLGNIGKPMLQALLKPVPKDRIFVLELSSYQLDDIKFSPDIAVVTNLFPEHMDFHGNVKKYYETKKNIIQFSRYAGSREARQNYFIYNPKNAEMKKWLKDYKGKAMPFSKKTYQSNLIGEHNKSNVQAAVSVTKILGIPENIIKKAAKNFKGLPHRLELVGEFKGIKFYDDAISTTPESTIQAIQALKNVDTIFLGGQDRGYDFSQLEKTIKKYKIKNVVLFPDSGKKISKSTKGLNVLKTHSMQEAVKFAFQNTKKGSVCLLSCASPSYSLWKNFEEKGNQFKLFIKKFGK